MIIKLAVTGPRHLDDEVGAWVRNQLRLYLNRAITKFGHDIVVISGMALQVDTWWAQIGLNVGLPLHAYIPSKLQTGWKQTEDGWIQCSDRPWPTTERDLWAELLSQATKIMDCSTTFPPNNWQTPGALLLHRSRQMVNDCTYLCGVWHGQRGGTFRTLEYAHAINRRTFFINTLNRKCDWNAWPVNAKSEWVFVSK